MEKIQVTNTLIRAKSIDEFRNPVDGRRIEDYPFFRLIPGGISFETIKQKTDAKELNAMIQQGLIYVIEKTEIIK